MAQQQQPQPGNVVAGANVQAQPPLINNPVVPREQLAALPTIVVSKTKPPMLRSLNSVEEVKNWLNLMQKHLEAKHDKLWSTVVLECIPVNNDALRGYVSTSRNFRELSDTLIEAVKPDNAFASYNLGELFRQIIVPELPVRHFKALQDYTAGISKELRFDDFPWPEGLIVDQKSAIVAAMKERVEHAIVVDGYSSILRPHLEAKNRDRGGNICDADPVKINLHAMTYSNEHKFKLSYATGSVRVLLDWCWCVAGHYFFSI